MNAARRVDSIVQEVTIRGSAERIFEALTTPAQVLQWWRGEDKFKLTRMDVDLRIGGVWKMTGTRRDGRPLAVSGVYRRIERPRLLVYSWIRGDEGEDTSETSVRFDLLEKDGVTTVRVTHSGFTTEEQRSRHSGWSKVVVLLQGYVEGNAFVGAGF